MKIYHYGYDRAVPCAPCVLALGFFDGVHVAHRELLERAKKIAIDAGLPFGVFTFSSDGNVKQGVSRIYTDEEKLELLSELGADFTVLAHFPSISGLSPDQFVQEVLVRDSSARVCVVGFNFRFGKGACGDVNDLKRIMEELGGSAVVEDEVTRGDVTVSSTLIRRLLTEGDIELANKLLVKPYTIRGTVTHGKGAGHGLGFPTVNTDIPEVRVIPRLGVYAGKVNINGVAYRAITNIGICPTLGERAAHAETHILDFSGDLYGEEIQISLMEFLRDERHFDTLEALKNQIALDIERTMKK